MQNRPFSLAKPQLSGQRHTMRLFLLTSLTMVAFAANSVLNRLALAEGSIDALAFATLRLVSGASILLVLTLSLRGLPKFGGRETVIGTAALLTYIYGFSLAYNALDAGIGALILFGVVQITMFAGALIKHDPLPWQKWAGAGLALVGLAYLLWPGESVVVDLTHGLLMAIAGVGWGLYSLVGRGAKDALASTTANFTFAALVALAVFILIPGAIPTSDSTARGVGLAIVSGAITSGLGYALWYSVLPRLQAATAAIAQLTVPIIALVGGMLFLGEALSAQFAIASVLVLGGVALSVARRN